MSNQSESVEHHRNRDLEQSEDQQVLDFVREYGMPLIIGLGAALVIYLGYVFYQGHKRSLAARAAQSFASAQSIEQLQTVVNQYGATPTGPTALLSLAANYLHAGQYALARQAYGRFEQSYPEHMMRPAAELGKTYCVEGEGFVDEALRGFTAFANTHAGHFLEPFALFGRARCLEQLGRFAEARTVYEDFIAANAESLWVPRAETALLYVDRELRANQAE